MRNKFLNTATAVGGLVLLAGTAHALPVSIEFNGVTPGTEVQIDGNAFFLGTVGGYSISAGATGSPTHPEPQLNTSVVSVTTNCDVCTLTINATETGLTFPTPTALFNVLNVAWNMETGDIPLTTFNFFVDPNNQPDGTTIALGGDGFSPPQPSGFNINLPAQLVTTGPGPFSETEQFIINFGDCATTACSAQLSEEMGVPEPASLSLLGAALIGFGAWRRRKSA